MTTGLGGMALRSIDISYDLMDEHRMGVLFGGVEVSTTCLLIIMRSLP
jgi:hypothetical protein